MKQWVWGALGMAAIVAGYAVPHTVSAQRYPGVPRQPRPPKQQATLQQQAESQLLPNPFPVYASGGVVVNHPVQGMQQGGLPTINTFRGAPGCYVACYSHDQNGAVYSVGGNIWVKGQVRVQGHYDGRVCKPTGYENADISAQNTFKDLCAQSLATCAGRSCWAGGDTGGWFGIP